MQRVNEQVDINIIVATGLYTFDEIPHFFHYRGPGAILDGPELMTALREHGVDEAQITAMLVHNPARYFTGGQE